MATYDKDLKLGSDGTWSRWIGVDEKGTKQNFRLGKDKVEATRRLKLIVALHELSSFRGKNGTQWCAEYLATAKGIAKGEPAVLPPLKFEGYPESDRTYDEVFQVANIRTKGGFEADPAMMKEMIRTKQAEFYGAESNLRRLTGGKTVPRQTGQTIEKAIEAYVASVVKQYTIPGKGLSGWGKTQCDQARSWAAYMGKTEELLQTDLSDVSIAKAQEMIDAIRTRPLTIRSKHRERMTPSTASNILKTVRCFWDWLDLSDDWKWQEPPRFRKLDYTVSTLTADERHEKKMAKDRWEISNDEIRILFSHATESERVLLLLGLNCAFGAGEIGNLRVPYVKLSTSEIDGIRFKTGNDTRHHLWPETAHELAAELRRRSAAPKTDEAKDIVFLTGSGRPLWKITAAGNYTDNVSKRWDNLIQRVRKHHPDFYEYSFGKLRKTAAIRIIEMADPSTASMLLAHGSASQDDDILSAYVTLPWKKLYAAQKAYGEAVRPFIVEKQETAKDYIGNKATTIVDLWKAETPAAEIARKVGVSLMTVYRHVDRAGLRA